MGYSTSLYAIDLVALRAAIGSNDPILLSRAQAACQAHGPATKDPTQGPRIKVTRDSQILLNGKPVTPEEMRDHLRDPKWAGTNLYWYHEKGQKSGAWKEAGAFMRQLQSAVAGTRLAGLLSCNSEAELLSGWDDEDELSEEQAVADLIAGHFSRPASSYGYGLQCLCQLLGVKLGVIPGKGRLKALKVDTPLAEPRSPTALPEVDDFPHLSYLSAEEVAQEARRIEAMDLAYPKSSAIEEDRRTLLQYLQAAAREGHAVVSFYS